MTVFPRVIKLLEEKGASDIKVIGGGIMPDEDIEQLESMGVAKLFTPGTPTADIVEYVRGIGSGA
jgi:methylmalonyl-CoA mutase C-terminal domain/subunit